MIIQQTHFNMKYFVFSFTLLLFWSTLIIADSSEEDSKDVQSNPVLKDLVKIVEKYDLNVTLVSTETKYGKNGQPLEILGVAASFPPNLESDNKKTINKDVIDGFLKLATQHNLTAVSRTISIADGNVVKEDSTSNSDKNINENVPKPKVYKWLTHYENGKQGFSLKAKNFVTNTNYIVNGNDGKNETVSIFDLHVEIDIVKKSDEMLDAYVDKIKPALGVVYLMVPDDSERAILLGKYLESIFVKDDWQVIVNPVEFYTASKRFALFKIANHEFLVFSFPAKK